MSDMLVKNVNRNAATDRLRAYFLKQHESGQYAKEWTEGEFTLDGDFVLSEMVDAVLGVPDGQ